MIFLCDHRSPCDHRYPDSSVIYPVITDSSVITDNPSKVGQHYKVLFMREWRSLRLNRKRRSRATKGRHLPLESGRSRQHYKVLLMREWRSLRLNRKRRSRATNGRHLPLKSGRSRQRYRVLFYARVAFLAPESQAPLARNELKTLVTVKLLKLS